MTAPTRWKVVVIEDSRTQALQLGSVLERAGFEVHLASDGESGVSLCSQVMPDVVISDIVMPGIDGFEVCRRIKADPSLKGTPVVLLTSLVDPLDVVRALAAGADNFVPKPYEDEQLVARLQRLAGGRGVSDSMVEVRSEIFHVSAARSQILDVLVSSLETVMTRNVQLEASRNAAELRAAQLRGLNEASLAIQRAGDLERTLAVVCDQARRLLNVHQAFASLEAHRPGSEPLAAVSYSERHMKFAPASGRAPRALSIYRQLGIPPRPVRWTHNALSDDPRWRGVMADAERPAPRGWLAVPMFDREGTLVGSIELSEKRDGDDFGAEDEAILLQLAQMASVALENARLYHETQRAVKAREEVIAVVSHDLRNPLSSILMAASLAEQNPENTERLGARLAAIRRGADRMNRLIENLLDVTKIDAGHLVIDVADVDVRSLLDEAIALQRPLADSKPLTLENHIDAGVSVVRGERERLQQVLSNLLGNAMKFTNSGGRIAIRATVDGGHVRFAVSDTGSGIEPENLRHVFDRFWQDRRTAGQGTGLGLAIVKGIVEAHHGRIWVESEIGKGTTFAFTIPRA